MNITTDVPVEGVSSQVVIYCAILVILAAALLFGSISKRSCIYLSVRSMLLYCYTMCCCCCTKHAEKVEIRGVEIGELLKEIDDV